MSILVVYETGMAVDCAAAAFLKMIAPKVFTLYGCSRFETINSQNLMRNVEENVAWDSIISIGTYWSKNNERDAEFENYCEDVLYFSFGDELEPWPRRRILFAIKEECYGPLNFALDIAKDYVSEGILTLFRNTHRDLINFVDQRALGLNVSGTQPFFTGFFNCFEDNNFVANFTKLFKGEASLENIQKLGQSIMESQIKMAAERAKTNSKVITLKNGKTALITEAPDLCNLSHDALRNFGDHPVTITVKMALPTNKMNYSVRTYDGTDARQIVEAINGGGSDFAAGGSIDFELVIPF